MFGILKKILKKKKSKIKSYLGLEKKNKKRKTLKNHIKQEHKKKI